MSTQPEQPPPPPSPSRVWLWFLPPIALLIIYLTNASFDEVFFSGIVIALLLFTYSLIRGSRTAPDDPSISDVLEDSEEAVPLCPGCFEEVSKFEQFCPHCSYPLGTTATIGPIQPYWAIAYSVSSAIRHPPAGIFLAALVLLLITRALEAVSMLYWGVSWRFATAMEIVFTTTLLSAGAAWAALHIRALIRIRRNAANAPTLEDDSTAPVSSDAP